MADKVFVVNLEELEDKGIELATLYHMSIPDLEKLAEFVLTPEQAVEQLNFPENADFNPEDYQCVYREIGDEEIHVTMGNDDWQEIIINKDLQVHISTNGGEGYNVDLYAYNEDTPDEERDASYQELNEARNYTEED